MSYSSERRHLDPAGGAGGGDRGHAGLTPGKTTLTEALQRKMAATPAPAAASPQDVAQRGTSGAAGALPHLDLIQRAFGRHDLRGVQAHTDEAAAESARSLGADAFATGDRIAFSGAPDLHTAAHEAAHVIQQRAGLVRGGVGAPDDHHERTADAVADRVVSGQSAEALLDELVGAGGAGAGGTGAGGAAVQLKPSRFQALSSNPLLSPSLLQQVTQSEWTAYITAVKPYFKISDKDKHGQRVTLQTAYSRAMSLSTAYKSKFTPPQRELAAQLNAELELERTELYGSHVGGLKDRGLETIEVHDDAFAPIEGSEHESRQDPDHCPLFTGPPAIDDVKQGNLGDCYLLAAIASLIEIDPMHFVKHMRDDLGGTVTVKLYKDVDAPVLVTVDKSVVVRSLTRGERYAKGAVWVQMLEKAYVASGLKVSAKPQLERLDLGEARGEVQPQQDRKREYQDISGGAPDAALMHLTGKRASSTSIGKERASFRHMAPVELQKHLQGYKEKLEALETEEKRLGKVKEQKLAQSKEADVSDEDKQLQGIGVQIGVLVKECQSLQLPILELSDSLRKLYVSKDMFEKFLQEHSDNAPLLEIVKQLVKSEDFLPGALGSGKYGRDELATFKRIKTAIDGKKAITASTRTSLSDQENIAEQDRGLAGESKVNGLASSHAYSVLAYRPKEPVEGEQIFIKLRNPWGSYGRKYEVVQQKVKGVADNQSDGTFWIDIADMLANFDRIDFMV